MRNVIEPALAERRDAADATKRVIAAALADPDGKALAIAMKPAEPVRLAAE